MFREALRIGLEVVMKNHVYRFDSCIRKQKSGGPIGLELTGNIAQVFMIWWDRVLKLRLHNLGIVVYMYKRYISYSCFKTQSLKKCPIEFQISMFWIQFFLTMIYVISSLQFWFKLTLLI